MSRAIIHKDTNRKIRTTFFIDYCVWILVPNSLQDMHSAFWTRFISPQTSPVFSLLLLEPFLDPQMYMNSIFLIILFVSLLQANVIWHYKWPQLIYNGETHICNNHHLPLHITTELYLISYHIIRWFIRLAE